MKQFVRFFSLGLFLASLIIFIFFYYFDEPEIDASEISTDELIELVEEDGYRVITEEDYISYTVNNEEEKTDKPKENDDKDTAKEDEEKEDKNDEVVKYTLQIKADTMPHEVIILLEEKKIIEDAEEFAKFMEKENYSPYIQQGEFELNSEMSEEEIAKAITNK